MDTPLIERLKRYYTNFNGIDLDQLDTFYSDNVVFKDPIHELRGLVAFQDYLTTLSANLTQCRFEYLDQLVTSNTAYLKWNMHFSHPRLGGKLISVRGVSQLQYDGVIYYHEDIYDMGSMVYEHIPAVGQLICWFKNRLAN